MEKKQFTASIITISDKGYAGEREDASAPAIAECLLSAGYTILSKRVIPDEPDMIIEALLCAANEDANLVLTTGGTGFSKRDVTPEATRKVIEKEAPGIAEAIRADSMRYTPRAMLSRGVAGIRGDSLIINLPGSPKAVKEALSFVLPTLGHGIEIMLGTSSDCARKDG